MRFLIIVYCLSFLIASHVTAQTENWTSISNIQTEGLERVLVTWHINKLDRLNNEADLGFMAEFLAPADLVVLQGIGANQANVAAVTKLCELLNRQGLDWDYLLTEPTPQTPTGIRYACLWRSKRLSIEPYHFELCHYFDFMTNKPALINFSVGLADYQLYVCHLAEDQQIAVKELENLAQKSGAFGIKKTILAGSFNASPELLQSHLGLGLGTEIWIKGQTTLKKKGSQMLRHKCDDNVLTKGVDIKTSAIVCFDNYFQTPDQALAISNHLPIAIILRLR